MENAAFAILGCVPPPLTLKPHISIHSLSPPGSQREFDAVIKAVVKVRLCWQLFDQSTDFVFEDANITRRLLILVFSARMAAPSQAEASGGEMNQRLRLPSKFTFGKARINDGHS